METVIIAFIGAFATIAAAFITSRNPAASSIPRAPERRSDEASVTLTSAPRTYEAAPQKKSVSIFKSIFIYAFVTLVAIVALGAYDGPTDAGLVLVLWAGVLLVSTPVFLIWAVVKSHAIAQTLT